MVMKTKQIQENPIKEETKSKNIIRAVPKGTTPVFAFLMIVCAFFLIPSKPWHALFFILCSLCIFVEKSIWKLRRIKEMKSYIADVAENDNAMNNEAIFKTLNPVVGLRIDGSVAWYNSSFRALFDNVENKRINDLLPDLNIREIYDNKNKRDTLVHVGEDVYKVTATIKKKVDADHAALMLYMESVTEFEKIKKQLTDKENVIAEIVVDNFDEAIDDAPDEERIDMVTLLEKNILGWVQDEGGIVKKLEKDKFVCVFTKKQLDKFIENKFEILSNVKSFNPGIKTPLTISIGIGTGDESIYENDISAKKALEMALGRGGDQVVIRENGKFRYFGGNSKETEKRTRVKARMMAHNLKELMLSSENVIIMGHRDSDADAVGAAMGIASMANFIGKKAAIVLLTRDDTVGTLLKNIEENHYHDGLFIAKNNIKDFLKPKTLLVVCDTHVPEYTEMPELLDMVKSKVLIDHHRRSESFINGADLVYHEPFASSACEMVAEIMQYFDSRYSVSTIDAEALYAGIVMDTKNFMFKTGVRTFEAAAYLRDAGVDTVRVKKLFRESIDTYKLKARIVTEAQVYHDNIAISLYTGVVSHIVVAAAADELLEITNIKASFVVARSENDDIIISGRSLGDINVQLILEKLGGGGHMMVAGAQLNGTSVTDAGEKLKNAINVTLDME